MTLDTRYIPISTLPQFLFDKITGAALGGGVVEFYQDNSQSTPKDVYQLVSQGSPPTYTYQNVGSLLTLNSVGTFIDGNGSEFVPYLFPFDGNASTTMDIVELYYVVAKNISGVPQFTLHGVPNISDSGNIGNNPNLINHIPNGQFQIHNEYAPVPGLTFNYGGNRGSVSQTSVAPGGIYFERSLSSTANDSITFLQSLQYDIDNSASPRYSVKIIRSVASADSVCGLVFRFMDVFKFTNPDTDPTTSPKLTFLFNAVLGGGVSLNNISINHNKINI